MDTIFTPFFQRHQAEWYSRAGTFPVAYLRDRLDKDVQVPGCPFEWLTYWRTAPSATDPRAFERWQSEQMWIHPHLLAYLLAERRLEIRMKLAGRVIETFPILKSHPPLRLLAEGYYVWQTSKKEEPFSLSIGASCDEGEELLLMVNAVNGNVFISELHSRKIVGHSSESLPLFLMNAPLAVGWTR